jgi:hypothetical protein
MHGLTCRCPKCQAAAEQEFGQFEFASAMETFGETDAESPLSEAEEIELAMELLAVSSEAEMDQFIGKLFKGAWKGIKKVGSVVGKIARPLGGVLKAVAKKALPFVGGALGSFIPIPGVGTAVGSALGGALAKALELETAGVNLEEQEFEMARRFVRIAATAARQAAMAPEDAESELAVQDALLAAARTHLPNLEVTEAELQGSVGHPGASRLSGAGFVAGETSWCWVRSTMAMK